MYRVSTWFCGVLLSFREFTSRVAELCRVWGAGLDVRSVRAWDLCGWGCRLDGLRLQHAASLLKRGFAFGVEGMKDLGCSV